MQQTAVGRTRAMERDALAGRRGQTLSAPARAAGPIGDFRLTIVTDAWRPQINGVARTYEWLARALPELGVTTGVIAPPGFPSVGLPTYPEIRLAIATPGQIARRVDAHRPDIVHIATEGPLGFLARRHCRRMRIPFTTCYHTRFPEYLAARAPVPTAWSYAALRRFHAAARMTMVATPALRDELQARGFRNLVVWRRGVDVELFAQAEPAELPFARPIFLYAGRLAIEKNIDAFLDLALPGTKVVAGDGPERARLQNKYSDAKFLGKLDPRQLARVYKAADVFVFPSRTDTFGLVMAEALAAGTPVAAYVTPGARAIFEHDACGVLDDDLERAALAALEVPRQNAHAAGARHAMALSAANFVEILRRAAVAQAA